MEVTPSTEVTPSPTPNPATNPDAEQSADESTASHLAVSAISPMKSPTPSHLKHTSLDDSASFVTADDDSSGKKRKGKAGSGSVKTGESVRSREGDGDVLNRWDSRKSTEEDWGIGDDVRMGLS